ncbi:MAG: 3-deoxy-7-phosphoheptulonate synthase, partial [Pseudomonadota bacterium]|nr:3-deoxy-7-phosphoheptulonate synthase [Pseudomonadota bacterium]
MSEDVLKNLNVVAQDLLVPPSELEAEIPVSESAQRTILDGRRAIEEILDRQEHRLLVVVGPCSIHDARAARDYADRLAR